MLKSPTSRRNSHSKQIELNLVPILDAMVTLIGFLLFTTSFLALVSIESPFPQASPEEVQERLKEQPLQLTLTVQDQNVRVWSSFGKIPSQEIPNTKEGLFNVKAIHEALLEVKKKFPQETTVVFVPTGHVSYEELISLMDSVRTIEPTDPPIYVKNEKTGLDEPAKGLFPKIVFGNLLEDNS